MCLCAHRVVWCQVAPNLITRPKRTIDESGFRRPILCLFFSKSVSSYPPLTSPNSLSYSPQSCSHRDSMLTWEFTLVCCSEAGRVMPRKSHVNLSGGDGGKQFDGINASESIGRVRGSSHNDGNIIRVDSRGFCPIIFPPSFLHCVLPYIDLFPTVCPVD